MDTPTPTSTPALHIKTAARKLPIKRKTPLHSQSPPLPSDPNPNPNPNSAPQAPKSEPYVSAAENGYDDYDEGDDEEAEEVESEEFIGGGGEIGGVTGSGGDPKPPPFKFHRIWSESDEIRFLQGLLGCWSQGMVFPRDLNLFYDRFSESMPQPYTRSQLSEKLRRLRKKFRIVSGRIARGQDPSRLAPHDRDLLHLCNRLWHPSYAASSPFPAADAPTAGAVGNKRRRQNPRTPSTLSRALPSSSPTPTPPLLLPAPQFLPPPPADEKLSSDEEKPPADSHHGVNEEKPLSASAASSAKGGINHLLAKTVLDVFDGSLKELRTTLLGHGMLQPDHTSRSGSSGSDFTKRWQEQRIAELDVLACRLRPSCSLVEVSLSYRMGKCGVYTSMINKRKQFLRSIR